MTTVFRLQKKRPWPSLLVGVAACALPLASCEAFSGQRSAAALVREGDAKACNHSETLALVDKIVRGAPQRSASADETAALPIEFANTVMTAVDAGVSVVCLTEVSVADRGSAGLSYQVLPAADGGPDIVIQWDQRSSPAIELYDGIRWSRENSRASANEQPSQQMAALPTAAPATASAQPLSDADETSDVIYEGERVKIVASWQNGTTVCVGCGPSGGAQDLEIGVSRFEIAGHGLVLLTPDTGNYALGGTTYALDVDTGALADLETHSGAEPTFAIRRTGGKRSVDILENDQARTVIID